MSNCGVSCRRFLNWLCIGKGLRDVATVQHFWCHSDVICTQSANTVGKL